MIWQLQPIQTAEVSTNYQVAEIALDVNGDIEIPMRLAYGDEAVAIRLRTRLMFWQGEWFLDQRLGVPYRRDILVKNPSPVLVVGIFRKVIEDTPGVKELKAIDLSPTPAERSASIDFDAVLAQGSILTARAVPFIFDDTEAKAT